MTDPVNDYQKRARATRAHLPDSRHWIVVCWMLWAAALCGAVGWR